MGILTYLKVGAVVIILSICGYYIWNYHHMQTKIVALQTEIEGLKLRAEVVEKAQKATDEYMKAKAKAVKQNAQKKAQIDTVVEAGDDPAMRQLFINNGLLKPSKAGIPASGSPGRPGDIPAR